jgi:hypothetical protein
MRVHFVFIGEGSSDSKLVSHLENLCIELGVDEVTGIAADFARLPNPPGKTLESQLQLARHLEPTANLFFLHRDADSRNAETRYQEITKAVQVGRFDQAWTAVVPVQEIEAWLLLDENAIRTVVGKPRGRKDLSLPTPNRVESIARPKEALQIALITAAEESGKRLEKVRKSFPKHRDLLIQRLAIDGPVTQVPSWQRLRADLQNALKFLEEN